MPDASYNSGMSDSFSQTMPGKQVTAPKPTAPGVGNTGALSQTAPTSTFSKPIAQPPAAVPATTTTSNLNSKPAAPVAPAAVGARKVPVSFQMKIPDALVKTFGAIAGAGANMYQQSQNLGVLGNIKDFLGQPQNFANILGALAPVADPVLRAGGLPLMLGAYSMLKDHNYVKDLSGGRFPKLGAAIPATNPMAFNFPVPSVLGAGSLGSPTATENDLHRPLPQTVFTSPNASTPTGERVAGAVGSGGALAGLGAEWAAKKAPAALRGMAPAVSRVLGPAVSIGTDVADAAGLFDAFEGREARPWRDTADRQIGALHPANWVKGYSDIHNDPNISTAAKPLLYAMHTLGNPGVNAMTSPHSTSLAIAKSLEDAGKSVGTINRLSKPIDDTGVARWTK